MFLLRYQHNFQPSFNNQVGNSPKTPKQRLGMGTTSFAPSPERLILQMSYLEKKFDDVLDRIVEQNSQLLTTMNSINDSLTGEIRILQNKVGVATEQIQTLNDKVKVLFI